MLEGVQLLVQLEWHCLATHAISVDDDDFNGVARVDVAFAGGGEAVLDEIDRLRLGERRGGGDGRVEKRARALELVVKNGHDERLPASLTRVSCSLVASDGVVCVDGTLARLVESTEQVECVVWEETLEVERVRQHLRHGRAAHGLPSVVVREHLLAHAEHLVQLLAVPFESRGCENAGVRQGDHLGMFSREDRESR